MSVGCGLWGSGVKRWAWRRLELSWPSAVSLFVCACWGFLDCFGCDRPASGVDDRCLFLFSSEFDGIGRLSLDGELSCHPFVYTQDLEDWTRKVPMSGLH